MAKGWLFRAMFALSVGAGVASCGLLTGVGDLYVGSDEAGGGSSGNEGGNPLPVPIHDGGVAMGDADAGIDPDASIFGDIDSSTVDGCSPTGCFDIPSGFQLVAIAPSGQPCPTGFGQPTPLDYDPVVGGAACSCGCNTTVQPTCPAPNTITQKIGNAEAGTTCPNLAFSTLQASCSTDGFNGPFNNLRQYNVPVINPSGGACAASTNKDGTKMTAQTERLCQATVVPRCDTKICLPTVDAPNAVCIAASGDVDCPDPFSKKTLTGSKADFTCSGDCACPGVSATCGGGKIGFYGAPDCSGNPGVTFPANGTCVGNASAMGDPSVGYAAHKFLADPPGNVKCSTTGSAAPSAPSLSQVTTVCCN